MVKVTINVPEQSHTVSEVYKALRSNLKFCGAEKKVIAVTSCVENEGKSTVSLQLAVSLAMDGNRVCLLDCDLRKSVLIHTLDAHRVQDDLAITEEMGLKKAFGDREIPGISHYLSRQASLKDVIAVTSVSNLYILFAGPTPPNPAEMLGRSEFEKAVKSLSNTFDYVIIDTPPVGAVIDGAIIATQADGIIIVLESGNDSYRLAQSVMDQLKKTGTPIIGGVLNKVEMTTSGYGGYYGSYYGKYYGTYADGKKHKKKSK